MKRSRIESLESLRGIAFLGIFLLHAGCSVQWATLGVSVFFVLSGFLLTYQHFDSSLTWGGYRSSFDFAVRKISKLYPLHIITMFAVIIRILISYIGKEDLIKNLIVLGRDIILNIFLLQSWYPNAGVNVSLNGVAWYLSAAVFHYFMFPYIIKKIRRLERKRNLQFMMILLILIAQLGISAIALIIDPSWGFYRWAAYDAPFFRMGDFLAGCVIGLLYLEREKTTESKRNLYEIIIVSVCIGITFWDNRSKHISFISQILNNWTTIYIPMAAALAFFFADNKGVVTKRLSECRILQWLGKKSSYYFLIHYVVIQYAVRIAARVPLAVPGIVLGILEFILTVILTEMYRKSESRLQKINYMIMKKIRFN